MELSEDVKKTFHVSDKWQLRCRKCGKIRDAADFGCHRISDDDPSWTLGWCGNCGKIRMIVMEPK